MRKNNFILALLLLPSVSWGNFCAQGSPLAQQWRDQSTWTQQMLSPSSDNNILQFSSLKDEKGQTYLKPYDISGSYSSPMTMNIQGPYDKQKFIQICKSNGNDVWRLTHARENKSRSEFRLPITYLPSPTISSVSPYKAQGFTTDGIGARIILGKDSLLEKSVHWPSNTQGVVGDIEKTLRDRLASQIKNGLTGSVELALDGMDDVVCDLMSGRLDIEFYHFATMTNPQVEVKSQVQGADLQAIYTDLTVATAKAKSKEENAFAAGSVWRKRQMDAQTEVLEEAQAYKIIAQMFEPATGALKVLPSEEVNCLADNESEFTKRKAISSVKLRLKTPSIFEVEN